GNRHVADERFYRADAIQSEHRKLRLARRCGHLELAASCRRADNGLARPCDGCRDGIENCCCSYASRPGCRVPAGHSLRVHWFFYYFAGRSDRISACTAHAPDRGFHERPSDTLLREHH